MMIGGWQKFSLLDYPDHMAAIIFTQGCNFRCPFCYNPMLVEPIGKLSDTSAKAEENQKGRSLINPDDLFAFLRERQGKLDAVVVTGGEPTIQSDLPEFLARIKDYAYKIKIDTNGANPKMIEKLLAAGLVDYLAMDIKAAPDKYDLVAGVQPELDKIRESVKLIMDSGRPYEFRTTLVPELHAPEDIAAMGEFIKGAEKWYLQHFRANTKLLNINFEKAQAFKMKELEEMRRIARKYVKMCEIR
jgi:pyruvate formate lyase activating enzyme